MVIESLRRSSNDDNDLVETLNILFDHGGHFPSDSSFSSCPSWSSCADHPSLNLSLYVDIIYHIISSIIYWIDCITKNFMVPLLIQSFYRILWNSFTKTFPSNIVSFHLKFVGLIMRIKLQNWYCWGFFDRFVVNIPIVWNRHQHSSG